MRSIASGMALRWRNPDKLSRLGVLLLAVGLPVLASGLTDKVAFLHPLPFALDFLVIAIIATFGGYAPPLVAVGLALLSHAYFASHGHLLRGIDHTDLLRGLLMLVLVLILCNSLERFRRARERHELALRVLEERTKALGETLNASKCASWTLDLESGRSARWYRGSYPIFGRPFDEIEALPSLRPLIHSEDQPRFPALVATMQTSHQPVVFEFRTIWPNGEMHWMEMRATRVLGPGCVWRGVTVDITERKIAELTLIRQEKLAAMGRLASTVAHEINNPLEAVTNLLYLAGQDDSISDLTRAYLATAEKELARLGDITRLTLGFVRNSSVRQTLTLASVVEEVFSIFRHRYEMKNIQIVQRVDREVQISMAPHELRQILTNLISNAADALNVEYPRVAIHIASAGEKAVLTLEDNGTGIAPDALPRIFDPFFTTKADVGTGIGLWVTRELVESNQGTITAESGDLGNGMRTRFQIELPLVLSTSEGVDAPVLEAQV
jgi:signal transduction histidine kinase